jgi:hypothetical protein
VIDEIRGLLDQYAQRVRDKSVLREVNDQYVEITTAGSTRKEGRPAESRFYAFLNDENRAPSATIVDALRNYDIVPQ